MDRFKRIPLYLGGATLVLALLVSSIQLSSKGQLIQSQSQATVSKASLTLQYTAPDILTLLVSADKEIGGIDAVVSFDKNAVEILPSTLTSGGSFTTTGASIGSDGSTFQFSALPKAANTTSGIVAQFRFKGVAIPAKGSTDITLQTGADKSAVIDKNSLTNVLSETAAVTVPVRLP